MEVKLVGYELFKGNETEVKTLMASISNRLTLSFAPRNDEYKKYQYNSLAKN
jgi:hypothetical protein